MPKLSEELHQSSFENPQQRLLINVLYTSAAVKQASTRVLRPHGLTWQQFNLLRILRGQCGKPASMRLLQERMLDPQSNASRLVDKLERKGLATRTVSEQDKRRVRVALTEEGRRAIELASRDMTRFTEGIGGPSLEELTAISEGLDRFRENLRGFCEPG